MKKLLFLLLSLTAIADTPSPGIIRIEGGTTQTIIGNIADALKVNIVNITPTPPQLVYQPLGSQLHTDVDLLPPVTQGTNPWLISGNITTTPSSGPQLVIQPLGSLLHTDVDNFPATQAVTQSTSPWVISGTVTSIPSGSQTVVQSSGSLLHTDVDNFPSSQTVTGTVSVNNFPASQAVTLSGSNLVYQGSPPWTSNITQVNGSSISLGQKTSAASLPVVIASDQSTIPVSGSFTTSGSQLVYQPLGSQLHVDVDLLPAVTQGTNPWVVSGNLTATVSGPQLVYQPLGSQLHTDVDNFPASQLVTQGTSPWITSGSSLVSGTVSVNNFPATQPISGSVSVSNFPATQPVSGTVTANQGSPPWTVTVSGSQIISGSVSVTNFPATQAVTQSTSPWVTNVSQFGGNNVVTGTGTSGSGIPRVTVSSDSSIAATQSGTWSVNSLIMEGGNAAVVSAAGALKVDGSAVTQPVSQVTSPWIVSGSSLISGSVSITNFPATQAVTQSTSPWIVSGSSLISGSVSVSNFPATQPISGTVTALQGTSPWIVSGSSLVSGTVNVGNFPATQPISGSVSVLNFPATQAVTQSTVPWIVSGSSLVSGTVSTLQQADIAPATQNITIQDSGSTTTTYANGQNFITGTPTNGSAASFSTSSIDAIEVQMTGSPTGTFQSEVSMDGGVTWFTRGVKQSGAAVFSSSFTSNFEGGMNMAGMTNFRVRAVAAVTGTAIIKITGSINPGSITVSNNINPILGRAVQSTFTQSYTSTNLSTAAFTTIISSASLINEIDIFDNSGGLFYLAYASTCGSLSNTSNAVIIGPGGGGKDFQIPYGQCVGFEAIGSNITSGNVYMTFYK
jgi:hypothetical protein